MAMNNKNLIVSNTIIAKLKENKLIPNDDDTLELKIANGTIRESEWKLIFEQQIINENIHITDEIK